MKTEALKQALDKYQFDAAFGGARREEEKSRAKERVFSFRDKNHRWTQRISVLSCGIYITGRSQGREHSRLSALELDGTGHLARYLSRKYSYRPRSTCKERPVVETREGLILVDDDRMPAELRGKATKRLVRFRTSGAIRSPAAVESSATTLPEIIEKLVTARSSERQGRVIDLDQTGSMEEKKQEGYF